MVTFDGDLLKWEIMQHVERAKDKYDEIQKIAKFFIMYKTRDGYPILKEANQKDECPRPTDFNGSFKSDQKSFKLPAYRLITTQEFLQEEAPMN